ncbi:radical SAM protein [Mesorhizobium sp. ORM6]
MSNDNLVLAQARTVGLAPGVLGLNILPTEKCNFRCVYCYENFPNVRMTPSIVKSVKNLLDNRKSDLTDLSIGWFGGEPLLESETVLDISRHALSLSRLHGFSYLSHITTNGYFLDELLFDQLVDSGVVKYQITLDGTKDFHNKTRRSPGIPDNYTKIFDNLLSMRGSKKSFRVTLRLHLHRENFDDIKDLIDIISEEFGGDRRFTVTIHNIKRYSSNHKFDLGLSDVKAKDAINEYLAGKVNSAQIRDPMKSLQCCYASMPNHFVVRANGRLQKCTIALYDERNDIGELGLDGSINIYSQEKIRMWASGIFDGDALKLKCPWIYIGDHG